MGDASEGGEDRGWACVDVDARRRVLGRPVGQARAQPDASSCSPPSLATVSPIVQSRRRRAGPTCALTDANCRVHGAEATRERTSLP
jgi:hypothetical protein